MADRTKKLIRTIKQLVDRIGELVAQPLSDESYEVPRARTVRRSKAVARRGSGRKTHKGSMKGHKRTRKTKARRTRSARKR